MYRFSLGLLSSLLISTAIAGVPAQYTCGDLDTQELFITTITESNDVIFKNNLTGVEELSTVDIFTIGDTLTLVSGQLDIDGNELLEEYCGPVGEQTKMLVVGGPNFEKLRCLSCTPLDLNKN